MKNAIFTALLILTASCGKEAPKCVNKEAATLQCQAEELAKWHFPSDWQQEQIRTQCERLYTVNKCY